MSLEWWLLVAISVLLITGEIFIGAFVVLWFWIGAVLAVLLTLLAPELNAGVQILLTALTGGLLLYFFRHCCVAKDNGVGEGLYTFSAGRGVLSISDDGQVAVSARGVCWGVVSLDVLPEADRIDGKTVEIERFEGNRAVLAMPRFTGRGKTKCHEAVITPAAAVLKADSSQDGGGGGA